MAYNIPLRVKNLIKKADSPDPRAIAAAMGIRVRLVDMPTHINGCWKRVLRRKFIFVSDRLEEWQQKAVIGHELGHIILHPQYHCFCLDSRTYYCSTKHENEADAFSVALMKEVMPEVDSCFVDVFLKEGWR